MTLKSICSEICKEFKESLENDFPKDLNNDEIFAFAYDICESKVKSLNFRVRGKCKVKSEESRKAGNEKFGKNLKWEAFQHYNESIALAPVESQELAFGYGNRATCLISLGFPQEALQDLSTALSFKISEDYRSKLLARKEKCLNLENKKSEWFFGFGKAVFIPNCTSVFDCGSDSIDLLEDDYYERQIIAKNDIKTGQILIVEKPFSSILLPQYWYTHCSYCFVRNLNLIPCHNCSEAMFCDEKCRKNAFEKFHKTECSLLFTLKELKAERMELLALRILIQSSNQGEGLDKLYLETEENNLKKKNSSESKKLYKSLDFYNIYNLVTNTSKRTVNDLFYRSVVSVALIMMLEKLTGFFNNSPTEKISRLKVFSGGLILRFKQSLPCNAHEISEFCQDGLHEVGAGAYATLSLINHSCDPNVVRHSVKDAVVLRAIRPIKRGEQIFDNYGYHYATLTYEERQKSLMSQYYFKCNCEPCLKSWPTYADLPNENVATIKQMDLQLYTKLTEKFEKNLMMIFDGVFNSEMIEECMKYLDFLDEYVKRPWMNFNNCQEAIKHCLSFYGNHFRTSKGV